MRPVNLIPPEDRRGDRAPLRSGPIAYMLIGALALALLAVTGVVMTGNQIKEREAEAAGLEVREAEARARAESLSAFTQFASVSEARLQTVTALAQSRFDWERVLRELALVIPEDIWLVNLTGTVAPDAVVDDSASITLRNQIPGPALSLVGCGDGQEAVAGFVEALRDIDGVTRVGVASSALPGDAVDGGGDDCRTRDFIARFEVVAAFDEVAIAPTDALGMAPAPAAPPAADPPTDSAAGDEGAQQADSGSGVVPGVAR